MRVVYKHFVVHPDTAMDAHLAACAANKQGKFMEFEKAFWEQGFDAYAKTRDPSKLGRDNILKIAGELGLNTDKLVADMDGDECKQRIQKDMAILRTFGVGGTPSFFVNGKFTMYPGPEGMDKMVAEALAAVEESGVPADEYYQKVVVEQGEKKFRSKADAEGDSGE